VADANSVFNICQRIAGALGIGLIAAMYYMNMSHFATLSAAGA
jgi:hypothetical protein